MSPEAQRIAIAEAIGWTEIYFQEPDQNRFENGWLGYMPGQGPSHGVTEIPKIDLNAMHEAEKTLNEKQVVFYQMNLMKAVKATDGEPETIAAIANRLYHATAAQRSEAFLRTIGKWEVAA